MAGMSFMVSSLAASLTDAALEKAEGCACSSLGAADSPDVSLLLPVAAGCRLGRPKLPRSAAVDESAASDSWHEPCAPGCCCPRPAAAAAPKIARNSGSAWQIQPWAWRETLYAPMQETGCAGCNHQDLGN